MAVEPAELDYQFIRLTTKPTAQICYSFQVPASSAVSSTKPLLVVFLNGLGLQQTSWAPLIVKLKELRPDTSMPMTLTYDRFGQGQTTDRDPQDERASDPMHAHDCMSAIKDLRQLIVQIIAEMMGIVDTNKVTLVFVSNSIGCALTRLYVQEYPGTVAGILLLDSVLANSDFVSVFPDPDSEGFDASKALPDGINPDTLRTARERVRRVFHPDVGNKEGLSRKNLSSLLPKSDSPVLKGVDGRGPYVTVVGHDFETFAEQGEKMGSPKALAMNYTNPYWHAYNQGLSKITEPARSKGPLQAPGCGHFVQQDNPAFVAQELDEILSNVM
ncbi:Alpha/Beta hydrolase protein [Lipomyces doorenjongii]